MGIQNTNKRETAKRENSICFLWRILYTLRIRNIAKVQPDGSLKGI